MFLVGTTYMPPSIVRKVVKRFIEASKSPSPPFLKRVNTLVSVAGKQWFKVITVYEVADEKTSDGIKEIMKYESQFTDIEGYKYQLEVMMTPEEAIPLIPT
ncbi:hypothetical protein ACFLYV_03925 [Chloroflexota bacterium]